MTTIEWVEESDWGKVAEGDWVRLEKGKEIHQLRAANVSSTGFSDIIWPLQSRQFVITDGFTLYVEAKPAVELPSEPGLYLLDNHMVVLLLPHSRWVSPNGYDTIWPFVKASETFTRLEPVAETAKKVLDAIDTYCKESPAGYLAFGGALREVRAEFGVTS